MNDADHNAGHENDGEGSVGPAWSETDWENFLREQDEQVRRYLAYYEEFVDEGDRIDAAARLMGWQVDDPSDVETPDDAELGEDDEDDDDDLDEDGPYTIQKHPVYVSSRALCLSLQRSWERAAHEVGHQLPPKSLLAFQSHVHHAELNAVMAVQSFDLGDFVLAVGLLKRALADLNDALHTLGLLEETRLRPLLRFAPHARTRLFDLREIWLRVMRDCREEQHRRHITDE